MPAEPSPLRVGAVILHYNRPELAADCLESLRHQTLPLQALVLVDNGSTDRFGTVIEGLTPAPHILHLAENRGFAGGVNAGIRWLNEHADIDCVWLLNNDTLCPPGTLEHLVTLLAARPECAAVSATLEEQQPDGSLRRITGGHFPLPLLIPFVSKPGNPVDYLCGACILLRRHDPALTLHVIGRADAKSLAGLRIPGITLHGPVPDLKPWYSRCRLFIAPTRFSAGIPLKILDAAAHGLPSVITAGLAAQLNWTHHTHAAVADAPPETLPASFAEHTLHLYNTEPLWTRLREHTLADLQTRFTPEALRTGIQTALEPPTP